MRTLLLVFSILVLTVKTFEYQIDRPQTDFQKDDDAYQLQLGKNVKLGTQLIKGNNGQMYEVTIYPSRKLYETHLESTEQLQTSSLQSNPSGINSQQPFNNQQQQFNNLQQTQDRQQSNLILQRTANQQTADSFIQRAHASQQLQQFGMFSHQQQQHNNNLINKLVNNQKYYVSQSEASQLDVQYKQLNNNPRAFLRIVTKCNASGQCESQNVSNSGVVETDLKHQQVLQQSRAQVQLSADESQQKFNNQFTGNALTSNAAKALRGIPISKGTDLKNRRLFYYCEFAIPQYPHN